MALPTPILIDTSISAEADRLLDAALAYARRGYRVFPTNPDKTPSVHWKKVASNAETYVSGWWHQRPDANIGLALPKGIVVFDVDTQHGGSLDDLAPLPETVIAHTGSGGWHVYFTLPEGFTPTQNTPLTGIDTRIGGKGYVVLPPSIHECGTAYTWRDDCSLLVRDPAPIPPHLLKILTPEKKNSRRGGDATKGLPGHYWLEKALARIERRDDTRNNTGLWLACQLRDNGIPEEDAEDIMLRYQESVEDEGDHPYTEDETLASLRSAYGREARDLAGGLPRDEDTSQGWVCAAEVQPREIDWLWGGRIPLGMLTGLIGDGSVGKSLLTAQLAAHVSTGKPLPGEVRGVQGGVLLLNAEDPLAEVVVPRLQAAGAGLPHIHLLDTWSADGLPRLEDMVRLHHVRLIIIDPIASFLGNKDGHKEQDVRRLLTPLKQLAENTGAAIVAIRHLPKNESTRTQYRGSGSIAFTNVARSELLLGKDPDDESRRILTVNKGNLSKPLPSLTFSIAERNGVPYLHHTGESHYTAADLLHTEAPASATRQTIQEALRAAEGPMKPKDLAEETGLNAGLVRLTLRRMVDAGEVDQPTRGEYSIKQTK